MRTQAIIFLFLLYTNLSFASLEDYGSLPKVSSIAISPNGKLTALIQHEGDNNLFVIVPTGGKKAIAVTDLGNINANSLFFISDNKVILTVSDIRKVRGYTNRMNFSASYVYDIRKNKIKTLLNKTWGLYPAQSGLGKIVGYNVRENRVYMPAYSEENDIPYNLYSVNLETGKGVIHARGNTHTIDWIVDESGNVVAREDYHNKRQIHKIVAYRKNKEKVIYSKKTSQPEITLYGRTKNNNLIYVDDGLFYEISTTDGDIQKLETASGDIDIRSVLLTLDRQIIGIEYDGIRPFYELVDSKHNDDFTKLDATFPNSQVSYLGSTQDKTKILAFVSGNDSAGSYLLFDTSKVQAEELAYHYPNIKKSQIGEIKTIAYKSKDGIKIPSILTWPPNLTKAKRKNLPLLVFPHGGPESNDTLRFNWWAQYFANKGYLILQPNFRGSSGFGKAHITASYGQWGKKMQSDLSDGVSALVRAGYADPNRVCIMGGSYGGYAALAAGAFSPKLYRCVISFAGISDLNKMLFDDKKEYGKDHFVVRYWEKSLGNNKLNKNFLEKVSPINSSSAFAAPVLLIHGKADTVVPFKQSKIMHKALTKAGRESSLITIDKGSHWLSKSEDRLKLLKEIEIFLEKHNPTLQN